MLGHDPDTTTNYGCLYGRHLAPIAVAFLWLLSHGRYIHIVKGLNRECINDGCGVPTGDAHFFGHLLLSYLRLKFALRAAHGIFSILPRRIRCQLEWSVSGLYLNNVILSICALLQLLSKNKTNHPISSNSHPSATANNARHSLKIVGV